MPQCDDHDILIRLDENVKEIKDKMKDIPERVASLEAKTSNHSKIIWTGISLLTIMFGILVRIALAMS